MRQLNFHLAMSVLGGLLFLWVFGAAYGDIDPNSYRYRDDGVITLSHAKNWVDYGHIGVNPSGERIEAYSAPLQFFIYAVVYKVSGMGWHRFMDLQTILCTFLLGAIFIGFFRRNYFFGFWLATGSAFFLSINFNFLGWHGSGMENCWHHVFLLWSVFALWRMWDTKKLKWVWFVPLLLASMVRHESIFHLAPILALFGWWMYHEKKDIKVLKWLALLALAWSAIQLWRVFYFGSYVPNSGVAQGISIGDHLNEIFSLGPKIRWWSKAAALIFSVHGLYFLLVLVPLLPFAKLSRDAKWVLLAACSLAATAYFHPIVFGPARLDWTRTTTFAPVFVTLGVSIGLFSLRFLDHWRSLVLLLPALYFFFRIASPSFIEEPRELCCAIEKNVQIQEYADRFAQENEIPRLSLATPDLGKISYTKKYNIVDLGLLGSHQLTQFSKYKDANLIADYIYGFALPDFLEFHHYWIHKYGRVWTDQRFGKHYEMVLQKAADPRANKPYPGLKMGMFVRKALKKGSLDPEYALIQDLQKELSLKRIKEELGKAVVPGNWESHQYVVRTAYRFLPEFRELGKDQELASLFENTPSAVYDLALLSSARQSNWWRNGLTELILHLKQRDQKAFKELMGSQADLVHERDRWRFYQAKGKLFVSILNPQSEDLEGKVLVHAFPGDVSGISNPWGAVFLDFALKLECAIWKGSEAIWEVDLPKKPLTAVLVGRLINEKRIWTYRIPDWYYQ